jgi:hypothetical protein
MTGRTAAYGRAAFVWAVKRGMVPVNPFAALPIAKSIAKRERVLSDHEIAEIWTATSTAAAPYGSIIRLLILTGQRRGEVAGMAWGEISADLATWTMPGERTKNGVAHVAKHPAVTYLVRLHADIGGRIKVNRQEYERLAADMKAVEAVIRMFDPTYDVAGIVKRPRVNGNPYFKRDTLFRDALSILRTTEKPMSARELILGMLAAKGVKGASAARVRSLANGLAHSHAEQHRARCRARGEGWPMRWRIA